MPAGWLAAGGAAWTRGADGFSQFPARVIVEKQRVPRPVEQCRQLNPQSTQMRLLHSPVLPCSGGSSAGRLCPPRSARLRAIRCSARRACSSSGDSGSGAPAPPAVQLNADCQACSSSSGGGVSPAPVQQTRTSGAPAPSSGSLLAAAALLACAAAAAHPAAAVAAAAAAAPHGPPVGLYDVAEGEEFWGNVAKYGRYFVTVMLGTGYVMVQPLMAAFKRPATAAAALAALVGGGILLKLTLDAMLGIQEPFVYEPGSVVPYL